ncbi:porin family protein [Thiotrichales bacterium 19S3-7]|nr:porin family protein [Thiotrichales bacterium 19S3-7]MCF6801416.1 porin family protein [Thiotrichales bacterium 19S3-11]
MFRQTAIASAIILSATSLALADQGDTIVSRNQVSLNSSDLSQSNLDHDQYLYTPKKTKQVSGFYIGAQLGGATLNSNNSSFATSTSGDISKDNGNLYTGITLGFNYAINDMFGVGVETGYNYGYELNKLSVSGKSADISVSTIPLFLTGNLMFSTGFNLFAKIGGAYVRESNSGFDNTTLAVSNGDGTANAFNFAFGLGAGYFINNFNIKVEYDYIAGNSNPTSDSATFPINALTLGVTYTFPSAIQF